MPLSSGAAALIARMSPAPNPSRAMLIASTYDRMASRSYWAKLDCLYLLAAHNSQASRLNWKADEFNIAVSGSPTFTTDRGWAGALSSYLDTGFAPSTAGRNYALNSATLMGWSTTAGAAGIDANFLSVGLFANLGGSATGYLCPRRTTNQINARINDPAGMTASNTATDGMFTAVRDSATSRGLGHNDTMVGGGQVSSSIAAGNLILLPGENVVSNLTMSAAAAGSALTAAEVALLYNDLLPYMQAVTPQDVIGSGAAQFLSEKTFEISSLDTGPISFVEPWGGSELAHSYTFALGSGAPASVSLDPDTGLLVTSSTLAPGAYTFPVVVANLKDTSKVSTFWIMIAVREGVTSNRTGYQILHKDYGVDSLGAPVDGDWATKLLNLRKAIVDDQIAAGDNNFCASIIFNAGGPYDYTDNRWTFGIQRLKIKTTTPGTKATLRNIKFLPPPPNEGNIASCSLQLGRGWANNTLPLVPTDPPPLPPYVADASKLNAYFINSASAGQTTVTLKTSSDASHFTIGRWVAVACYDQQTFGFPANARYVDYAKVQSIAGAVITLDRKLRWTHSDTYWESTDTNSLGKARLIAIDRNDCRATLRLHMQDIDFQLDPNTTVDSRRFMYAEGLEQYFKNVSADNFCVSQSRHAYLENCDIGASEFDKLTTRVVMVGGSTTKDVTEGLNGATGVELLLLKNVAAVGGYAVMPMQYRLIGGTMDGQTYNPVKVGSFATRQIYAKGTTFTGKNPVFNFWAPEPVTVGSGGVTYSSGVLTVPVAATNFIDFVKCAFEGCLIYATSIGGSRYGYITAINRNSDDSAILYSITWIGGSAPANGDVLVLPRVHELFVASDCVATNGTSFNSIALAVKQTTPGITTRNFPAGYPASTYGF